MTALAVLGVAGLGLFGLLWLCAVVGRATKEGAEAMDLIGAVYGRPRVIRIRWWERIAPVAAVGCGVLAVIGIALR